jgi:hypothetical protein
MWTWTWWDAPLFSLPAAQCCSHFTWQNSHYGRKHPGGGTVTRSVVERATEAEDCALCTCGRARPILGGLSSEHVPAGDEVTAQGAERKR